LISTCLRLQRKAAKRKSDFDAWDVEQDSDNHTDPDSDTEPDSDRDSSEDAALEAAYASSDGENTAGDASSSDGDEPLAARCADTGMG
jgi:hypothetical protein